METFKLIFLVFIGLVVPTFFIVVALVSRHNKRKRP